ncbi:uncharacterized protein LOC113228740 isoform X1 [Hyposmocoma kahamanoa]|uniref:uncharacterized protein LOC113228740 isoform X1 n=1 Tax=Hyposmocoma kahamanoa TaxID=1477025 RepID=UPI000E6DA0E0|nr:uncharacterized protein LOC113228740 isoform X1 [Hyposmocoma kahamanoa]
MANTTNKIVSNELDALNVAEVFTCLPEECLKFIDPSKYSLKIIHQNIRSINKNIDQFVVMLEITKINYDVIILSECWLSKLSNLPELTGYLSCKSLNNRNQNNGVVVYFKRHLDLTFTCPNFSEANCVLLKNDNLAILAIYRSPANKCLNGFFCDLNNSLSTLKSSRNVLLIGDINIDISSANTDLNKEKYLNLISSHGLLPTFDTPTRISSCLDHALLKSNYKATVLLLECNVTDHFPVITCLNLDRIHVKPNQSFSQTDFVSLRAEIMAMDFSTVLLCDNADHAADLLVNSIAPVLTKHTKVLRVPKRKVIFKPWITPGLLRCIRHRDKLYKRSKVNPDDYTLKRIYTRYRNFCNRLLRKLKREYEREELEKAKNNPKATWNALKRIANLNSPSSPVLDLLTSKGNPVGAIDGINEFFANVGKRLADKIINSHHPRALTKPIQYTPCNSLAMLEVCESEVASIITNRTQKTRIDKYISDELPITFGVPQGSILAPTLFKIYINELCQLPIPFGKTISYADDTVLVVTGPNWSIAKSYAEQALRTALDWLDNNLLTVNIEKTKYIPFSLRNSSAPPHNFTITAHSCPTPTISCQCMNLTRADHIKYLGVHIDSALRWHLHVDNLCSRVRKLIFVMSKLRNSAERNTLLIVYQALCKTLISYCIPVWGGAHKTSLLKLERAQRAVLKTMLSRPFRYPTTQLYQESNVLTVRQLFVLQITVRHHSSVPRAEYHCSTRRRKPACTTAIVRSTFASQQYTCISAFLYNKIDKLMKLAHLNKYELKKKLITWLSKLDYDSTEELLNRESLQCIYLIDK